MIEVSRCLTDLSVGEATPREIALRWHITGRFRVLFIVFFANGEKSLEASTPEKQVTHYCIILLFLEVENEIENLAPFAQKDKGRSRERERGDVEGRVRALKAAVSLDANTSNIYYLNHYCLWTRSIFHLSDLERIHITWGNIIFFFRFRPSDQNPHEYYRDMYIPPRTGLT